MNGKEHIPFILRHYFRDFKTVYGSDTNVSAVCRMCSKTFQRNLYSPTAFESHLKSKYHDGLYEEYLKLRPPQSAEKTDQANDVDGPIVALFKRLIIKDKKRNTVLTNKELIDILEKELFLDVNDTHGLEVEIYLNVIKKFLKEWPDWDDFEKAVNDLNTKDDAALEELFRKGHINLKDYLHSKLDIAKHLATGTSEKLLKKKEVELDITTKNNDVVMEIQATKAQLNNLILRYPKNNNIFNTKEPDNERTPQVMCLDSIINSCGITIEMRIKYSNKQLLFLKYENKHVISHKLVNKKLKIKSHLTESNQQWQVKYRKKEITGDLFKEAIPNCLNSYYPSGERVKWKNLVISMFKILKNIMQNMPARIDTEADYKRYLSPYSFVRYLYNNCAESDTASDKYDIQLEEIILPMCLLSISILPKEAHEETVTIHCDTCEKTFSGFNVVQEIEEHVSNCHDAEPDWTCMNCNLSMNIASLTAMNWQHKCPSCGPVASTSSK